MKFNSSTFRVINAKKNDRYLTGIVFLALFILLLAPERGFSQQTIQIFNSSTPWSCPSGVTSITVYCIGAGGAGGGASTANSAGSGGGGGAFTDSTFSVTPGNTYSVNIGSGGIGIPGGPGSTGGSSWFGSPTTVVAVGGFGGAAGGATATSGGVSTSCIPSDNAFSGGSGAAAAALGDSSGGGGGGAGTGGAPAEAAGVLYPWYGTGGNAGDTLTTTAGSGTPLGGGNGGTGVTGPGDQNGNPGVAGPFGGGGGGGSGGFSADGNLVVGGNGGDGLVVFVYYRSFTWTGADGTQQWEDPGNWDANDGYYPGLYTGDIAIVNSRGIHNAGCPIITQASDTIKLTNLIVSGAGITVTLAANAYLAVYGLDSTSFQLSAGGTIVADPTSTIEYADGTAYAGFEDMGNPQIVNSSFTYGNLYISTGGVYPIALYFGGVKYIASATNIAGNLTVSSVNRLDMQNGTYNVNVGGNVVLAPGIEEYSEFAESYILSQTEIDNSLTTPIVMTGNGSTIDVGDGPYPNEGGYIDAVTADANISVIDRYSAIPNVTTNPGDTFTIPASDTLIVHNPLTNNGNIAGPGTLWLSGPLVFPGPGTNNPNLNLVTNQGSPGPTINANSTVASLTVTPSTGFGYLYINTGDTLSVTGTYINNGTIYGPGTLALLSTTNAPGGSGGTGSFDTNGSLNLIAGNGSTTNTVTAATTFIVNNLTVRSGATLLDNANITCKGNVTVNVNGLLSISNGDTCRDGGNLICSGTINNNTTGGAFSMTSSGVATLDGGSAGTHGHINVSAFNLSTLNANRSINATANLEFGASTNVTAESFSITLANNGNIIFDGNAFGWATGNEAFLSASYETLINSSTGTMTAAGELYAFYYESIVTNNGTISCSNIALGWNCTVTNNGTVHCTGTGGIVSTFTANGQQWTNNAGSSVDVAGPFFTDALGGRLIANAATNTVIYDGTIAQIINPTTYNNLTINRTAGDNNATLTNGNDTINGILHFQGGNIATGANSVVILAGGSVTGAAQSSGWVNGNLQGDFATNAGATNFLYAMGDATEYAPLTLAINNVNTAGGPVNITGYIAAADADESYGSGIDQSAKANRYWFLSDAGAGTFSSYNAKFDFTNCSPTGTISGYVVRKFDPSAWASTTSSVAGNTITATGLTSIGTPSDFEVGDICIVTSSATVSTCGSYAWNGTTYTTTGTYTYNAGTMSNSSHCDSIATLHLTITGPCSITLSLTMFIQGYYQHSPSGTPMNNGGSGGCLYLSGISTNPLEVDTIKISLMNPATQSNAAVDSVKGILHTDGTLWENGSKGVIFPASVSNNSYYIKITSRNAMETWSSSAILFSSNTIYDFTTSRSQAYGSNMVLIDNISGQNKYAMWSGDVINANTGIKYTQDGAIESADYSLMEHDYSAILFGYYPTDLTGDGTVESADLSLMEENYSIIIFKATPW